MKANKRVRDLKRRPKHLDAKGNSTTCIYFTGHHGQVVGRTTTFVTPERRKRGR